MHITGHISTAQAWALNTRENNSCVHIYATNDTLADDYESQLPKNKNKSKLSSPDIQAKPVAALANNRGVLGQGNFAWIRMSGMQRIINGELWIKLRM